MRGIGALSAIRRPWAAATLLALLVAILPTWHIGDARAAEQSDRIIVSGASGHLGNLVVQELLARGVPASHLILVTRTPADLAQYARLGASVRFGDLTKPESLPAAYAGGTRMLLISISGAPIPRPELHKRAFDAAVRDGVRQIVYTSYLGVGRDHSALALDHERSENYLKASGAAWTILRNGFYADMLIPQAAQMVAAGRVVVAADEPRTAWVTRADCAAAAAGALTTPGHDYRIYDITGPAPLGRRELATLTSQITGRPIAIVVEARGAESAARTQSGANAATALPTLPPAVVSDAVAKLAGRPPTTVRALLSAHRAELLGTRSVGSP